MKKLLLIALLFSCQAFAFDGLVTQVHDGDTLTVTNELGASEKIRLAKVDAPELKSFKWGEQPYAQEARKALADLCIGKTATVDRKNKDKYGRTVASVSCQSTDVAAYMIKNGDAWAYRFSSTRALRALQASAKAQNIGLWANKDAVEPIIWRKNALHQI